MKFITPNYTFLCGFTQPFSVGFMKQKSELTSTYKDCEKEVRELKRKQENLNQNLGQTQPNPAQEQPEKNKIRAYEIVKSTTIIFQVALFTFNSKLSLIHI